MSRIRVLDVTLRDGGCVNEFNFGQAYMQKILQAQMQSGVDIIELGYIDSQKGTEKERTQFNSEVSIRKNFLINKHEDISYVAMIDYGKYNLDLLEERQKSGIDGIRLAFHKKDIRYIADACKKIIDKGYELYIQPMITLRYSDEELLKLITIVNERINKASAFYIVDSFGEMRHNDVMRILNLVDHNLVKHMTIGFHSHNNLQMSYSNAISMIQFPTSRDIIIDSSIMGMGKGAGNLNTELLLEHLNIYYGANYNISPLLEVIDKVINQIHSEFYWGYAPEYYLSSINHCTPSYASYFYSKHMLPINQVSELLGMMDDNKKISFDTQYAEKLYREYNEEKTIDDYKAVKELTEDIRDKEVILIAPGKKILTERERIFDYVSNKDAIVIGLNVFDIFKFNYVLTTRAEIYKEAFERGYNIIVTSNISKGGRGNVKVLDYKKWIEIEEKTYDSSAVVALNLLEQCKAKKVNLIGFDGFSPLINDNYYDDMMRYPVSREVAKERNAFYSKFIKEKRQNGMNIEFITKSLYQCDLNSKF